MAKFSDRTLTCTDCGSDFIWTAGEQEFYREHNLKQEPKRCKPCRDKRKQQGNGGRNRH